MKINQGKGYVEMKLSGPGKVAIIIAAKDKDNPLKTQVNSAEISITELSQMIKDLGVVI
jgi:hypothetical protein